MHYYGNAVSRGIALGNVHLAESVPVMIDKSCICPEDAAEAMMRYYVARNQAKEELLDLQAKLRAQGNQEQAEIFATHCAILTDVSLEEMMCRRIMDDCMSPEWAVHSVYWSYADHFSKGSTKMVREKAVDLIDVGTRLLRILQGGTQNLTPPQGEIVVVRELMPSEAAHLNKETTFAVIAELGGRESHAAIIVRNKGIPAIFGVKGAEKRLKEGETVIVDAEEGVIITRPTNKQEIEYGRRREQWLRRLQITRQYLSAPSVMEDGTRIELKLNLGEGDLDELSYVPYVDGAGLFRTEFLFLEQEHVLSEQEQFEAYRSVLLAFGKKPVTMRTMDLGCDKLPYGLELPEESNPALGLRGIRFCFAEPELFRTQLRAALRASVYGNLRLMFPMVSSIIEIRHVKEIIEEVRQELKKEGKPVAEHIPLGIMIETPAIALIADLAAKEVDFASIGTNDLCQYICAADRLSPCGAEYYRKFHPATFRMIQRVAEAFQKEGKPLSVCGEMGGDSMTVGVLIGLGIRSLSVSESAIAPVKELISRMTLRQANDMARQALSKATSVDVRDYLESCLSQSHQPEAAGSS